MFYSISEYLIAILEWIVRKLILILNLFSMNLWNLLIILLLLSLLIIGVHAEFIPDNTRDYIYTIRNGVMVAIDKRTGETLEMSVFEIYFVINYFKSNLAPIPSISNWGIFGIMLAVCGASVIIGANIPSLLKLCFANYHFYKKIAEWVTKKSPFIKRII